MSSNQTEPRSVDIAGCSVQGEKNEQRGVECQDYGAGRQFDDGRFVVGVADGLGSASNAAVGAKTAVEAALDFLEADLPEVEDLTEAAVKERMPQVFSAARSELTDLANQKHKPESAFQTTLQVLVGGPSGVAGAAVGDGGIVCELDGDLKPLVPREQTVRNVEMYAGQTTPLQSDNWTDSYRFGYEPGVTAVAAFSDGLSGFVWGGGESIREGVIDQALENIKQADDVEQLETELSEFLKSDKIQERSSDDKTLYVASVAASDSVTNGKVKTSETPRGRVLEELDKLAKAPEYDGDPPQQRRVAEAINGELSEKFGTDDLELVSSGDGPSQSSLRRFFPTLIVLAAVVVVLLSGFGVLSRRTSVVLGGGAMLFGTVSGDAGLEVPVWTFPVAMISIITATAAVKGSLSRFLGYQGTALGFLQSQGGSTQQDSELDEVNRTADVVAEATAKATRPNPSDGTDRQRHDEAEMFLRECFDESSLTLTTDPDRQRSSDTHANWRVVPALAVALTLLAVPLAELLGMAATLVQYLPNLVVVTFLISWVVLAVDAG